MSLGCIKKARVLESVEWYMEAAVVVVRVKGGRGGEKFGEMETET